MTRLVPLFPLPNLVLLPRVVLPLHGMDYASGADAVKAKSRPDVDPK